MAPNEGRTNKKEPNGTMQVVTQDLVMEKACTSFGNRNLVYSPSSIEVALGMVAAGSKGETLECLLNFLGLESLEDLYFRSTSAKLMAIVSDQNGGPVLHLANGVWLDKRFPIVPSYQEILKKVYNSETKSVDFLHKANQVRRDVNSWVDKETKGLIKEILSPDSLNSNTIFVLANALYFKAAWAQGYQFDPRRTRKKNFHLLNGDTVSIPFMIKKDKYYSYGKFNDYKILKIPYQNGSQSEAFFMYFVLPDEKDGIKKLIDNSHANSGNMFDHEHFDLPRQELSKVMIPKFKFSYRFTASDAMKEVGLTRPFEPVKELTGIVDLPKGDEIFVGKMLQECAVEVDEEGTEAAAVTLVIGLFGAAAPGHQPELPSFIADHPFMFLIREERSGNMLFIGVILNPISL